MKLNNSGLIENALIEAIQEIIKKEIDSKLQRVLTECGEQQNHSDKSDYLTVKEAEKYLSISTSGIYRLINSGHLHKHKVGARTLLAKQEIIQLLNRRNYEE